MPNLLGLSLLPEPIVQFWCKYGNCLINGLFNWTAGLISALPAQSNPFPGKHTQLWLQGSLAARNIAHAPRHKHTLCCNKKQFVLLIQSTHTVVKNDGRPYPTVLWSWGGPAKMAPLLKNVLTLLVERGFWHSVFWQECVRSKGAIGCRFNISTHP